MASRELQQEGQGNLDRENDLIAKVMAALVWAKMQAVLDGSKDAQAIVNAGYEAAQAIDNAGPDECLHCFIRNSVAAWACFHMDEELLRLKARGWKPGQPISEALIRARLSVNGLGRVIGQITRDAYDALGEDESVMKLLMSDMLDAFGDGSKTMIRTDAIEIAHPGQHPGSPSKH